MIGDSPGQTNNDVPTVSRRRAVRADHEFLWQLHVRTMKDYVDHTWGWDDAWQYERFCETFDPRRLEVIELGQVRIGYTAIEFGSEHILLSAIEIAPEYQNRGIATSLIQDLLMGADAQQVSVQLRVLKVNPARHLYARLGFATVEETETHFIMTRQARSFVFSPAPQTLPNLTGAL